MSLPPLGWGPLAFVALIPWILLLELPVLTSDRPAWLGARPYRMLYLAGFTFWMMTLYWLCLLHWATSFGWVGRSLLSYQACDLPAFVFAGRWAVQRLGCPVVIAAPIIWTGLELAKAHLVTGFTMGSVSHTQYQWIQLIQLAAIGGPYLVSFVVLLVAALLARFCR